MNSLVQLRNIVLEPVIELEPSHFAKRQRALPDRSGAQVPDEWNRYWTASLADSGVVGLTPIHAASWHVPTRQLKDLSILQNVLCGLADTWGGLASVLDADSHPVLSGGLVLLSEGDVVLEPTCCSDLGNIANWQEAANCRAADWQTLWIGHPWFSVRFEQGMLSVSDLHEDDAPVGKYVLSPPELEKAIGNAEAELEHFS